MKKEKNKQVDEKKKNKVEKVDTQEKEINENFEKLEQEILQKKQLPKQEKDKINKKIFRNIIIADVIMAFLYFISLGSLNIESTVFVTDLKVFSMGLAIFSIILFEISYRKENGRLAIHGIETLVLAVFTLFSIYIYTIYLKEFHLYVAVFSLLFAVYYIAKSIIIYKRMKKKYFITLNDIEEIIKK